MSRMLVLSVALLIIVSAVLAAPNLDAKPQVTPQEIERLIQQLGDDLFNVRERASKRLVEIGKPALKALEAASRGTDPEVCKRAADIIEAIKSSPRFMLEGLRDADPDIRRKAIEALAKTDKLTKEFVPALTEALKDKDEVVRDGAVDALIRIDPTLAVLVDHLPAKAHVNGKYLTLQRRIKVEQDRANYTEFHDWGPWTGDAWGGHSNLPAGFWVYVYPYWYIWKDAKADN